MYITNVSIFSFSQYTASEMVNIQIHKDQWNMTFQQDLYMTRIKEILIYNVQ